MFWSILISNEALKPQKHFGFWYIFEQHFKKNLELLNLFKNYQQSPQVLKFLTLNFFNAKSINFSIVKFL